MEDLDAKTIICGIFMSAALRAAVHLGNDYADQKSAQADIEAVIERN